MATKRKAPFEFKWEKASNGYCLRTMELPIRSATLDFLGEYRLSTVDKREEVIMPVDCAVMAEGNPNCIAGVLADYPKETTYPMASADLHREFAKIRTSKDAMAFANTFGHLGLWIFTIPDPKDNRELFAFSANAERTWHWLKAAEEVRSVLDYWDTINNDEDISRKLTTAVMQEDALNWVIEKITFPHALIYKTNPEMIEYWLLLHMLEEPFSFIKELLAAMQFHKFDNITGNPTTRLPKPNALRKFILYRINFHVSKTVYPEIGWRAGEVTLHPKTLLAAIWLKVAEEVLGKPKRKKKCASCEKWFTPIRRSDAVYCSPACRQKAYDTAKREKKRKPS